MAVYKGVKKIEQLHLIKCNLQACGLTDSCFTPVIRERKKERERGGVGRGERRECVNRRSPQEPFMSLLHRVRKSAMVVYNNPSDNINNPHLPVEIQ